MGRWRMWTRIWTKTQIRAKRHSRNVHNRFSRFANHHDKKLRQIVDRHSKVRSQSADRHDKELRQLADQHDKKISRITNKRIKKRMNDRYKRLEKRKSDRYNRIKKRRSDWYERVVKRKKDQHKHRVGLRNQGIRKVHERILDARKEYEAQIKQKKTTVKKSLEDIREQLSELEKLMNNNHELQDLQRHGNDDNVAEALLKNKAFASWTVRLPKSISKRG